MAGGQRPLSDNHRAAAAATRPHPGKCLQSLSRCNRDSYLRLSLNPIAAVRTYFSSQNLCRRNYSAKFWHRASYLFDMIRFAGREKVLNNWQALGTPVAG